MWKCHKSPAVAPKHCDGLLQRKPPLWIRRFQGRNDSSEVNDIGRNIDLHTIPIHTRKDLALFKQLRNFLHKRGYLIRVPHTSSGGFGVVLGLLFRDHLRDPLHRLQTESAVTVTARP